jgi:prolyl-tRNA editing enzyme YbaK/EbsC (Cys-tRNA(Pro) deacylase)
VATAWPEPVERVSSFLRDAGAEARIEELAEGAPTAADAAAAVGCGLDQIVKSLVVLCDEQPVLALVPGDCRGDRAKITSASGARSARVASPEEVERETGFEPGAVAPFPLPRVDTVLLERRLLQKPLVWVGAGSHRHVVGLAPAELVRLSRARAVDVVSHETYDANEPKER